MMAKDQRHPRYRVLVLVSLHRPWVPP